MRLIPFLLLGVACNPDADVACDAVCPKGTQSVRMDQLDTVVEGSFTWSVDASCESLCEPEQTCLAPNVPIVYAGDDGDVFECQAVAGFSDIPSLDELDLSFGLDWSDAAPSVRSSLDRDVVWMDLADLDGDGLEDLIGYQPVMGSILSALSLGDGAFGVSTFSPMLVPLPVGAIAEDIDGDGDIDLVGWASGTGIYIWHGLPDGTWDAGVLVWAAVPSQLRVEDMDGDGQLDLLVQYWTGSAQRVAVLYGLGGGSFDAALELDVASTSEDVGIAAGDVDGDGLLDLAVGTGDGQVWRQGPARTFTLTDTGLWEGPGIKGPPLLLDLDGDGLDDWIASVYDGDCALEMCLEARLAVAGGGWEVGAPQSLAPVGSQPLDGLGVATSNWVGPLDVDGDGPDDWVTGTLMGAVGLFPRGSGAPNPQLWPSVLGAVAAGDVDGDGLDEVVTFIYEGVYTWVEVQWP